MANSSKRLAAVLVAGSSLLSTQVSADGLTEALVSGKASADLRLRYESVEQNNAVDDASAVTLRSRLGYTTGVFEGFSAKLEVEDARIVAGVDEYTVGPTGFNPGEYSVIADPEHTEVDQGFVQYKSDAITAKLGRQVITLDGHRFVGHVGWRQDRQTFDGFTLKGSPVKGLNLFYGFIDKRNRIFAEAADVDSADNLFNLSYATPYGKLGAYAYMLEVEPTEATRDTYGVSFKGKSKTSFGKLLYAAEFATQTFESGTTERDADYMMVEGGLATGGATFKVGYEVLGSDSGAYGFTTELATLHKFNGWADTFLGTPTTGLVDAYVTVVTKVAGAKVVATYHDFSADESTATVDDLGSEIDVLLAKKFGKHYSAGIKYAAYSAGDAGAGKVDADKLWIWTGISF